jgi:hypothetical protein
MHADLPVDFLDGSVAVDHPETVRFSPGHLDISGADPPVERHLFVLETIFCGTGLPGCSIQGSAQAGLDRQVYKDGKPGDQPAACKGVHVPDEGNVKPATESLVSDRGVGKAVAEDPAAKRSSSDSAPISTGPRFRSNSRIFTPRDVPPGSPVTRGRIPRSSRCCEARRI